MDMRTYSNESPTLRSSHRFPGVCQWDSKKEHVYMFPDSLRDVTSNALTSLHLPNVLRYISAYNHTCIFNDFPPGSTKLELLHLLFISPPNKMQYLSLDNTRNEIRVLTFLDPSTSVEAEDSVQCSIENVPLEQRSPHFQSDQGYRPNQKSPMVWDEFTNCVDLRDATLEQTTLDNITSIGLSQAHSQLSDSRYVWGDFEALSYIWGDRRDLKSITVNGIRKDVPSNLEAALRALRVLPETRLGMRYWVDFLCINQEDKEERNEQVKRMRDIYGRARAVILWMGQEEEMDGIAVQMMRHLCLNPCLGESLQLPANLRADGWPALFTFAQKPYWNRAWMIQELAMNQNSTLILCGKHELTRRMLRLGAMYCKKFLQVSEDQSCRSHHALNLGPTAWTNATRMRRLANLTVNPNVKDTLSSLLGLVRQADATDKRDKVYSILGLLDPAVSADVVPDYSLSVQQAYMDMMIAVVKNTTSLDQILYGGIPSEQEWRWPSCVPDSRLPFVRHHTQYLETRQASGNSPANVRFLKKGKNWHLLVCDGFQVDVVSGTTAESSLHCHISQSRHAPNRYSGRTSEALEKTSLMGHPGATEPVLLNMPWSWSCGTSPSPANLRPPPNWPRISQSSNFQQFHAFIEDSKNFRIGGKRLGSFFPPYNVERANIKIMLACVRLAVLSLHHRALITTETGYLGLAPKGVCRGDVVAILIGCKCHVVLRPYRENMYRVIGECYVHELMDGEILDQERGRCAERREFVLC